MIPTAITTITARIAELHQRFPVPFSMDQAMQASTREPTSTFGPVGPAFPVESGSAPASPTAERALSLSPNGAPAATGIVAAALPPMGAVPATGWIGRLPEAGQRFAPMINGAAERAGIDPRLLAAVVQVESAFQPAARSSAGAIGLGQLMPATARSLGVDPHDPQQNLDGAARYLREQLDRFGSEPLALAAYNAGPGRVASAGGIPRITETQNYVQKVSTIVGQLRSA